MNKSVSGLKRKKKYCYNKECEQAFFVMINEICTCLICISTLALPKSGNLEWHFLTCHAKYNEDYPFGSKARQVKWKDMKSNLRGQQYSLKKFCTSSKTTTLGSFKTSYFIAQKAKGFFRWTIAERILF